jgi:group II intron reverse transcriptase/maturase
MRNAETVLGVIRERGTRGQPLEDIYRQLFNRELYLRAYARLHSNKGAMTPGTTTETADGMSLAKIDKLIDALRYERFRWTPVRRTYIEKKNSMKKRPLGIPTWSDKLLQEVIRMILEAYYEPQFSDRSHGFRPGRGCHTALSEISRCWTGTRWMIEGDIRGCFDNLNHQVLMSILREKLHDNRFLRLIENLLDAGYLEDWHYNKTYSGTPQGGVVSPILANIYLDRLDQFVEKTLIPANTRGMARHRNPPYVTLRSRLQRYEKQGHYEIAHELRKQMQQLPSSDPFDPEYRRLHYERYADDFVLGFVGTKSEADEIKRQLGGFLRELLRLELSQEKTLVTNATTEAARFLGYEIVNQQADDKHDSSGRRKVNGRMGLRVPADVIERYCRLYMHDSKPKGLNELINDEDFTILNQFQSVFRGIVQYYLLATNVCHFGKLQWVMQQSLAKTLAAKHKKPRRKLIRKYQSTVQTEFGTMACLKVVVERGDGKLPLVAQFGGIPLRRQKRAVLVDRKPLMHKPARTELIQRLLADKCELCGSSQSVEVHHIRHLKDLNVKGQNTKPLWVQMMARRRRKTLVVCFACHRRIHAGKEDGHHNSE